MGIGIACGDLRFVQFQGDVLAFHVVTSLDSDYIISAHIHQTTDEKRQGNMASMFPCPSAVPFVSEPSVH